MALRVPTTTGGQARLEVNVVDGHSTVTSAYATSPLKLLTPVSRGPSVWTFTSSFGGGLVAGDCTRLDVSVGAGARAYVGTQSATRVYRNPAGLPCRHDTFATVAGDGLLVLAPDPVQPFAAARYTQRQTFELARGGSLVLVDWISCGRAAAGERWAFAHFESRNEVFIAGERTLLDAVRLDPTDGPLTSTHCVGRWNCLAFLAVLGPACREGVNGLLAGAPPRQAARRLPLLASVSPIPGGAVVRVAGDQVETVAAELRRQLQFLTPLLGDDPFARKW